MTRPRVVLSSLLALVAGLTLLACPGDDGEGDEGSAAEPLFPEDYAQSYAEVRDCRGSGDHNLNNIRILASPDAFVPYDGRAEPFPEGAVVLKEEYDFGDLNCEGPIKRWTVMVRLAEGSSEDTLDWAWQDLDADRRVVSEDAPACIGCHQGCGVAPDGYEWTCAMP